MLRSTTENGYTYVGFGGSAKWSPYISIALSYGRAFTTPYRVPAILRKTEPLEPRIGNLSYNYSHCVGLSYPGPATWEVDIRNPPVNLPEKIAAGIDALVRPFSNRYPTMLEARDALVAGDSWCVGGVHAWHQLVGFDFALDDIVHYRTWSQCLESLYKGQADALLAQYQSEAKRVA